MTWQPIETAPNDGMPVDLWVDSSVSGGRRVTDCTRVYNGGVKTDVWVDRKSEYVNYYIIIDNEGDEVLTPSNGPIPEIAIRFCIATHWMFPPEAPNDQR